ncbi:6541_t:CDS:1 [Diversispora eburnea]|uniref:6541_t:CDS:1 n=1 Tax=Diversispora eburnea TaxID=1213867 RepID=A0A9N8YQD5_9GLOM|nr:6541_t:CDS:1 [Diversispora eburnea]
MELNIFDQNICHSRYFETALVPSQDLKYTNTMKSGYKAYEVKTYEETPTKLSYYHNGTTEYSTDHGHHVIASHLHHGNLNNLNNLKVRNNRVTKAATQEANERPFRCTLPGCIKSYKNPNGLKYHTEHGHRSAMSDTDEKKPVIKPHKCDVPNCEKRYKNANGLKYHLEHAHHNLMRRTQ